MNYNKQLEFIKKAVKKRFKTQSHEKSVKSEYVDFTIIHDREFLPIDQSVTNSTETDILHKKIPELSQEENVILEKKEFLENEINGSLHTLCQKKPSEVKNPYQFREVTYTSNQQRFTTVYKKWTHCNISNNCFSDE